MTKLTTHVLDVYSGKPGKGIKVDLFFINGEKKEKINSLTLNNDGRTDQPIAEKEKFKSGKYELVFYIGDYFNKLSLTKANRWAESMNCSEIDDVSELSGKTVF